MKLTTTMVEEMNRKELQETLEDLTSLEVTVIRKMSSAKMRAELMAIATPDKKAAKKEAPVVVKEAPVVTATKLKGEMKDKGRDCMCQCGGKTKGGHFLPGHDAKFHSANNGGSRKTPKPCGCGCTDEGGKPRMTRGGRFLPGHDARAYSRLRQEEREEAQSKTMKVA